ncbi:MAG TPA: Holliday junction resolvase RuvX [Salinisphaeraceae bacterium]|nr:Holliday junction resolvase RuvX [Salinisphaeraceae bacterium]
MSAIPDPARRIDTALGFDFGSRRIGVAVGSGISGHATALTSINSGDWQALRKLIDEWRPEVLVVGLPLAADGTEQPVTRQARSFMHDLAARFALPVTAIDERYSTIEADARLRTARASGRKKRRLQKGDNDAAAAQVILEHWLATEQT